MAIEIIVLSSLTPGWFYKPTRREFIGAPVRVILFGGGGGGGGGTTAVAATIISGGGGGGGAARVEFTTVWDYIGVREWINIGDGGAGGASSTIGNPGVQTVLGGTSSFAGAVPVGVTHWDQVPYATSFTRWDPNNIGGGTVTMSQNNEKMTVASGSTVWCRSTNPLAAGINQAYFECTVGTVTTSMGVGLSDGSVSLASLGVNAQSFGIYYDGTFKINNVQTASGLPTFTNGQTVAAVYDRVGKRFWYRVAGGLWNGAAGEPMSGGNVGLDVGAFAPITNDIFIIGQAGQAGSWTLNPGGFNLPAITAYSGGGGGQGSTVVGSGGGGAGTGERGGSAVSATAGIGGVYGGTAGGAGVAGVGNSNMIGGGGGGGCALGNVGSKGGIGYGGCPGGGAGGGKNATPAYFAGGAGGENANGITVKGGVPITDPGDGYLHGYKPGQPGMRGRLGSPGGGGSGGAAAASGPGVGGVGGFPGGGGGGGGCSLSPTAGGVGGKGGAGQIIFIIGYEMGRK